MTEQVEIALPRLGWSTSEVAAGLGLSPYALRRRVERAAERGPDGGLIARIDLGIEADKRAGRWVFVVPPDLLGRWRR